jgi:hypothetical protein
VVFCLPRGVPGDLCPKNCRNLWEGSLNRNWISKYITRVAYLEVVVMAEVRKDSHSGSQGGRAFFVPVLWIAALLASYWVLADWQTLPRLISGTLAAIH